MKTLIFLLLAASGAALAAPDPNTFGVGGFAPAQSDPVLAMLNTLVGDIGGMGFLPGGPDNQLAGMFLVFNTATVAIASIMFMWHLIASTVNGAHDGEFLGKRYHTYWMPIRLTFAIFFLMPALNGYSLAQISMVWAVWSGSGIASAVVSSTKLPEQIATAFTNVPIPPIPEGKPLADSVYGNWRCLIDRRFLQRTALREWPEDPAASKADWGSTVAIEGNRIAISFGDKTGETASNDVCGTTNFTFNTVKDDADPAVKTMALAYKAAVTNALLGMERNAGMVARSFDKFYAEDEWGNAGNAWDLYQRNAWRVFENEVSHMLYAAQPAATTKAAENAAQQVRQYGWIGVGLAGAPAAITSFSAGTITGNASTSAPNSSTASANAAPVTSPALTPSTTAQKKSLTEIQNEMALIEINIKANRGQKNYQRVEELSREYDRLAQQAVETDMTVVEKSTRVYKEDTITDSKGNELGKASGRDILSGPFNKAMQGIAKSLATTVASIMKSHSNPIAGMQELGVQILGWAATILAIIYPLLIGVSLVFASLSGIAGSTLSFLCMLLVPALFFGLKLAAILPFTPMLMWIGAIAAYFVIFIESLFGAQMWAMAHIEGEGEGMGQKTMHGWMFFLNLMLRPAIMVISFYLATKLMGILGGIGSEAIGNFAVAVSNNSSAGWLASIAISLGALWVWIGLMESLIHTSYSLVTVVPNQVFAWLGAHFGSNVGDNVGNQSTQAAQQMAGGTGSTATTAAQAGSSAGGGARNAMDNAKVRRVPGVSERVSTRQINEAKGAVAHEQLVGGLGGRGGGGGGSPAPSPSSGRESGGGSIGKGGASHE